MPAMRKSFHSIATTVSGIPLLPSNNFRISHHFLSSCKSLKSLLQIHCHLIVSGFKKDSFTLTHLINSYSLFRKFDLARRVFDSTPNPGLIPSNSMIRAYTKSRHYKEALNMYHYMLEKGLEPDKYTFTFVLKACTGSLNLEEGILIHSEISRKGLEGDVFIGTGLVDMYCKMGSLNRAQETFDKMPRKDVVAWNAMIAGFSQNLDPYDALECFRSMQVGGVQPNSVSLLNLFPAVCKLSDIRSCSSMHGYAFRREFSNAVVNGMIDMYCKCGRSNVARRIFDRMWNRDDVSWGTMMAGYVHNGNCSEVLELFDAITNENLNMNNICVGSALLAAAEMKDIEKGKEVHACAIQRGIDSDVLVATPIVTMYAKCGELQKAKQLFDEIQGRDLVSWSALIAAFVQSGSPKGALSLFRAMQNENLKPNIVTLVSVLPACAELSYLKLGKSLHCYAVKNNVDSDVSIGTSLVSLYAKCGVFTSALIIFNRMPCLDVVKWNALINGYAQIGDASSAMDMFYKLRHSQVSPDMGSMVGVLPACALLHDLKQGTWIHGQIVKSGFYSDFHVKNALIDMYAKCGSLSSAEFLFNETGFMKDEVSWNVMVAGYMHNGEDKDAISTFRQMKFENFRPNLVTLVTVLPAAGHLADLREGMCIHACIIQSGFQSNTAIGNSLIDMYSKCGRLDYSDKFFNEMNMKDTVSWNVLLAGYAAHGSGDSAIELFSLMESSNIEVDSMSFLSILSACRHAGLVEQGKKFFYLMNEKHNIEPGLEHYACMVDLLGRVGLLKEAFNFIKEMPVEPDAGVWGALLGACKIYSDVKLGEVALDHLTKIEPGNPAHFVVLSSIYAQNCNWDDARSTRSKLRETGLKKTPGWSWIKPATD